MNNNKSLIVIPARYNSKRLPGKPLTMIAGQTLLQRVCAVAQKVCNQMDNVSVLVATDDERILEHALTLKVNAVMTPETCPTGTDRIIHAVKHLDFRPKFVINLQGDAPLTPAEIIVQLLHTLQQSPANTTVTPVVQLSWQQLDSLRATKINTPFSGTTAAVHADGHAFWFSKQIIPAIRNEDKLRKESKLSPVLQHLGIYAYPIEVLEKFADLPKGYYEQLEELEQLRLLENGYPVKTIAITLDDLSAWRGVDTPEDAALVEKILKENNQ